MEASHDRQGGDGKEELRRRLISILIMTISLRTRLGVIKEL